jgi:hypothetical protein
MRFTLAARAVLDADLEQLRRDHTLTLELAELGDLVLEPSAGSLRGPGPQRAGVEDLAATLSAARRLPEELTIRVVLPNDAPVSSPADAASALHRRAGYLATVAWRDGMAQRAMGLRQLPLGLLISALSWALAYVLGYFVTQVHGVGVGLLAVSAMLSITIAWVTSWMIVESTMFDWRPDARLAAAYDLLSRARLEVTGVQASQVPLTAIA